MSKILKVTVSVPSTWEQVLEEFLLQKQAEGKAERTLKLELDSGLKANPGFYVPRGRQMLEKSRSPLPEA